MRCSALSAGEPLAGTATVAARFLLLEHRGRWGRDPLEDTELPPDRRALAEGFDGRVLLIRRLDPSGEPAALVAEVSAEGGTLRSVDGAPAPAQLLLVCTHGRRDACCARLGLPLYDALRAGIGAGRLWQSSHHGGHRFAPNLLALPSGVQLGRVPPGEAPSIAAMVAAGRIPLDHYRGRTLYDARRQAAEIAVRNRLGLDEIGDVTPLEDDGNTVRVATPDGIVEVHVEEQEGPAVPPSCGAPPEPSRRMVATARW